MLSEIINTWDVIRYLFNGYVALLIPLVKFFFTMPILPFTIFGILGLFAKRLARR